MWFRMCVLGVVLSGCGGAATEDVDKSSDVGTTHHDPDVDTDAAGTVGDTDESVHNSAPTIDTVLLTPDPAHLHDTLTCEVDSAADPDGDSVELLFTWRVSGVAVAHTDGTIDETWFQVGDEVYCTVTPTDGLAFGDTLVSNTVVILGPVDTGAGCGKHEIPDCYGGCVDSSLLGNGSCDFSLNCADNLYDGGDCQTCGNTGMTWALVEHDPVLEIDQVGCSGCEPYVGDMACLSGLPVLCLLDTGAVNPGVDTDYYHGWASGNIQLSPAVAGCGLDSLSAANQVCEQLFGAGWRIGEFHDGNGGWAWWAYGDIATTDRFWTYIDDQSANCWD